MQGMYVVFLPVWYVARLLLMGWAAFYLITYILDVLKKKSK